MDKPDLTLQRLQILNAQGASGLITGVSPHAQLAKINGTGFAPGRKVYDPVTGQTAVVVGATTAYIPQQAIDEVKANG